MRRLRVFCTFSLCLFVLACGEQAVEEQPDAGSGDVMEPDGGDGGDLGGDGGEVDGGWPEDVVQEPDVLPAGCSFPAPGLSRDQRAVTLAAAPAQCGQAAYRWLDDASLGDVTAYGYQRSFTASALRALIDSQNIRAPREITYNVRLRQFAYLTQDRGELIEATAFIAYPTNLGGEAPRDVLLFLHGTTGFNDACAPSEDLGHQALAALMASFGHVVVVPDFIGLKGFGEESAFPHPYLVGEATAMASLDSVRAIAKLPEHERGDLCLNPRVVTFGGSQGGHAALWVDRLGPYYAPELELLGGVATVPPADLVTQAVRALQSRVSATGNTLAFMTTAGPWYGVTDLSATLKSPWDTSIPESLATNCSPGREIRNVEQLDELFTDPILEAAGAGELLAPWDCITGMNGLTTTDVPRINEQSYSYGLLFVLGENDELVHTPIEREAFDTLCEQGMPLQYLECAGGRHGPTTALALPEVLDFLDDRLAGRGFDADALCRRSAAVTCRGGLP
jgi:hypothetical protein